mgnify:FL=1
MNEYVDITGEIDSRLVKYDLSSNCAPVLNLFLKTKIFSNAEKRKALNFDKFSYIEQEQGIKKAKTIEIKSAFSLSIEHFNLIVGIFQTIQHQQKYSLELSSKELCELLTKKKLENKQEKRIYSLLLDLCDVSFVVTSYPVINNKVDLANVDSVFAFGMLDSVMLDRRSVVNGSVSFSAVSLSLNPALASAFRATGSKVLRMDLFNSLKLGFSKSLYRHLLAIYTGTSDSLKVERNDVYSVLGLDLGDSSYGNRKIREALSELLEVGIVNGYATTRGRSYVIDVNPTVFDPTGQKSKEEFINETLSSAVEEETEIDIEDFLKGVWNGIWTNKID